MSVHSTLPVSHIACYLPSLGVSPMSSARGHSSVSTPLAFLASGPDAAVRGTDTAFPVGEHSSGYGGEVRIPDHRLWMPLRWVDRGKAQ